MSIPDVSQAHLSAAALRSHWAERRPIERACYLIGGALVLSGLFHLGVFAVLARTVTRSHSGHVA